MPSPRSYTKADPPWWHFSKPSEQWHIHLVWGNTGSRSPELPWKSDHLEAEQVTRRHSQPVLAEPELRGHTCHEEATRRGSSRPTCFETSQPKSQTSRNKQSSPFQLPTQRSMHLKMPAGVYYRFEVVKQQDLTKTQTQSGMPHL